MFSRQFLYFLSFRYWNSIKESVQNSGPFPWFPNIPMLSGFSISGCQTIRPFFSDFHINTVGRDVLIGGVRISLPKLYEGVEKMNLYETIKAAVTTRQAAESFGLAVNKHGMARCPFHDDHHPSLKLDKRYYCFACGESGDVIDFTARFFGISGHSAAIKLARDFGIDPRPPTESNIPIPDAEQFQKAVPPCILSLAQDVQQYRRWKRDFAPESQNVIWDDRFVAGCRNLSHAEYLLDCALEAGCAA